jgi:hypothetical protein
MEPDQINVPAAAVFRNLEEVNDTCEAGLLRQPRSDVRETDGQNRIHLYRTLFHAVVTANLYVGTSPDPDAASDLPVPNALAQTFGEHHEESLRLGWPMAAELAAQRRRILSAGRNL